MINVRCTFVFVDFIKYKNVISYIWATHIIRNGWLFVLSLYKEDYLHIFLDMCPFDYTTVTVSVKVERS